MLNEVMTGGPNPIELWPCRKRMIAFSLLPPVGHVRTHQEGSYLLAGRETGQRLTWQAS